MQWFHWLGWVVAGVFGVWLWIERRGIAGIKRDLADARREVKARAGKL